MECWPRNVDITGDVNQQYPGWPRTISQFDNYDPPSWGTMEEYQFDYLNPVIQLIDNKTSEILYTVRIEGSTFAPHAPIDKEFTIKAGQDSPDNVIKTNARAKK